MLFGPGGSVTPMDSQARLQGSGAWRFGVFSAVMALVVLAFALLLSSALPSPTKHIISGTGLIAAGLAAAFSCRFRAARSEGSRRRAFNLWALACLAAAVQNLVLML